MLSLWFLGKIFTLVAFLVYLAFAGIVVRQVYLMTRTFIMGFEAPIRALAWVHLGAAIFAFLFVAFFL